MLILFRVDHAIMTLHIVSAVFLANLVSKGLNRKKKYPENEAASPFLFRPCGVSLCGFEPGGYTIKFKCRLSMVVVGQIFSSCTTRLGTAAALAVILSYCCNCNGVKSTDLSATFRIPRLA